MGLYICDCGNSTSDYRGGQCGNCYELHCWNCHELFLDRWGKKNGSLAKCLKCKDVTSDDEEEENDRLLPEVPELESDTDSDDSVSSKPLDRVLADLVETLQKKKEHIWKASVQDGCAFFSDKQNAIDFLIAQFKKMLQDPENYDNEGDLLPDSDWLVGLMNFELN